jgi:hypothetical protein
LPGFHGFILARRSAAFWDRGDIFATGQLAVLPGTSHVTVVDRADLLLAIIPRFLDAPMPTPE